MDEVRRGGTTQIERADQFCCCISESYRILCHTFGLTDEEASTFLKEIMTEPDDLKGYDYSIFG